jgi:hypothetical protein
MICFKKKLEKLMEKWNIFKSLYFVKLNSKNKLEDSFKIFILKSEISLREYRKISHPRLID